MTMDAPAKPLGIKADGPCRIWTGARAGRYGRCRVAGKARYVHRRAYEDSIGPIPDGMYVCHRCDEPLCYEPTHLFLGTNSDNQIDASIKGRLASRRAAAPRGERHGMARLTDALAAEIRASVRPNPTGIKGGDSTISAAARRYGVGRTTIKSVLVGRSWRHHGHG